MTIPYSIFSSLRIHESAEVFRLLTNYKYAYIKGEALSYQAFGKMGQRRSQDIDLLICRKDIKDIEHLLISNGFRTRSLSKEDRVTAVAYSHQMPPYKRNGTFGSILFDLNFDVFWGEYTGQRINIDEFLTDTIEMEVYGVRVKTLPPLKALIQLVLHHYKEMNSIYHLSCHNCINHKMFKEVYYLWKRNQTDMKLDELFSVCYSYEILPYMYYVLYFTNLIYGDSELEKYVDTFKTPFGIYLLDYYGLSSRERKKWRVDFQTRLKTNNLLEIINNDLSEEDYEKIERTRILFG